MASLNTEWISQQNGTLGGHFILVNEEVQRRFDAPAHVSRLFPCIKLSPSVSALAELLLCIMMTSTLVDTLNMVLKLSLWNLLYQKCCWYIGFNFSMN